MKTCSMLVEPLQLCKKPFSAFCSFDRVRRPEKFLFSYNKVSYTPKAQHHICWGRKMNEFPVSCFYSLTTFNPLRWTLSTPTARRCPHLPSALIRCWIIDCGQLVKSSSCFGGPPRPSVTRLLYCTSLYTAHRQGNTRLLALLSCL